MQVSKWIRIFLAVIGSILFLDGLFLAFLNKIHVGTLVPLVLGAFFCLYALFYYHLERFFFYHYRLHTLWRFGWLCFWIWLIGLGYFFNFIKENKDASQNLPAVKAIIVLGSGVENGQPSAILAKRLDTAAPVALSQPQAKVILTGGLDFSEKEPEALVMSRYLEQHFHIAKDRMILEDKSTSTELNLKNSKPLLEQAHINVNQPIAIVTSDFHTPRAAAIAKKQGYTQVYMDAAETPLITRYNAWLREYFAYASGWLLNEY
ncbi:YdcF family protein [Acinetobacter baumannii]|uniref:YdcF family protein n=1 Tax=Acinetobacter baumannii TaxID=470 RepID=UPI000E08DD6A|nr:YdcF family protein [Acinetobacter baumannii]RDF36836.1 YdcF family protein [Acinetobacter baumannii]